MHIKKVKNIMAQIRAIPKLKHLMEGQREGIVDVRLKKRISKCFCNSHRLPIVKFATLE